MASRSEKLGEVLRGLGVHVCGSADQFYGWEETHTNLWVLTGEGAIAEYEIATDHWVESKINQTIEKAGFYLAEYDAGTAMIWAN